MKIQIFCVVILISTAFQAHSHCPGDTQFKITKLEGSTVQLVNEVCGYNDPIQKEDNSKVYLFYSGPHGGTFNGTKVISGNKSSAEMTNDVQNYCVENGKSFGSMQTIDTAVGSYVAFTCR